MKIFNPARIKLQWFGSVDEGRQLELLSVDEAGVPRQDHCYPLLTLLKDDRNEELHVEIYTDKGQIQIKAKDLIDAIALAERETHSEQWYEDNVYSKMDTEQAADGKTPEAPQSPH
jgi:hypothetical protein